MCRSAGPVKVLDEHAEQDKENILPAAFSMQVAPAAVQPVQQVGWAHPLQVCAGTSAFLSDST
jgi:hypothetical protein